MDALAGDFDLVEMQEEAYLALVVWMQVRNHTAGRSRHDYNKPTTPFGHHGAFSRPV